MCGSQQSSSTVSYALIWRGARKPISRPNSVIRRALQGREGDGRTDGRTDRRERALGYRPRSRCKEHKERGWVRATVSGQRATGKAWQVRILTRTLGTTSISDENKHMDSHRVEPRGVSRVCQVLVSRWWFSFPYLCCQACSNFNCVRVQFWTQTRLTKQAGRQAGRQRGLRSPSFFLSLPASQTRPSLRATTPPQSCCLSSGTSTRQHACLLLTILYSLAIRSRIMH